MILNRRNFVGKFAYAGFGAATALMLNTHGAFINQANAASETELLKPGPLGDIFVGPANAPVTIIEYASLTCPHCAAFHANTYPKLKAKYIDSGKVRLIMRGFPLNQLDLAAFMLTRCVDKSKFFAFVDVLFKKQFEWSRSNDPKAALLNVAKFAGFTSDSFDACLKNEKVARGIYAVREDALKKFKINSTPTFFINGELMKGNSTFEEFEKRIAAAAK